MSPTGHRCRYQSAAVAVVAVAELATKRSLPVLPTTLLIPTSVSVPVSAPVAVPSPMLTIAPAAVRQVVGVGAATAGIGVVAVADRGEEHIVVHVTGDRVVAQAADHVLDRDQRVGPGLRTGRRARRKIDGGGGRRLRQIVGVDAGLAVIGGNAVTDRGHEAVVAEAAIGEQRADARGDHVITAVGEDDVVPRRADHRYRRGRCRRCSRPDPR